MATLSAWKFDTPEGAELAEELLLDLQRRHAIQVHDAATVSWPYEEKKPKTRQLHSLAGHRALGGAFWGLFFGVLFVVPVLGVVVGAASGAITGALTDVGIDDRFIKAVRTEVVQGTSALFVLSSAALLDEVRDTMVGLHPQLIQTNLTPEQEDALRSTFSET